ncbi:MAG: alkaline phosphatase D family protein [Pseudomonadota bacterium]|nr:alkaline phosphatase D family protein [Pseudomonadota bacterium]
MSENTKRREFLVKAAAVLAAGSSLVACGGGDDEDDETAPPTTSAPAEFRYGVASGDPLADRVMLWTHAKIAGSNASVPLTWQVASDAGFATLVSSGALDALPTHGFTAKADATGLAPGATYYYRFRDAAGTFSPVGTTRTLPAADAASVKLAVFSCSLYSEGFFNAYADAAQSGALYALHLGDYIYEFGANPALFGNQDASALGRVAIPANDLVSLDDYRQRYAQYRTDPDLQRLHASMPWITVWDDHEFAENAYTDGAVNHQGATQGDWAARKQAAAQAYHEWLPIRPPEPANLLKIYRRFDFGSLLSLHMLDTRIDGRDRQYNSFGDNDDGAARYLAGLIPVNGVLRDASRRMISQAQQDWLSSGLSASSAAWQFLGNQTVMARLWLPTSVLRQLREAVATPPTATVADVNGAIQDYLQAKATRASAGSGALSLSQQALLSPILNPRLPYNLDAWDGYPAQRDAILTTAKTLNKKLVALSGDSHNAWFTQLTTLGGDKVGVEFAGSAVTSDGLEAFGLGTLAASLDGSALVPQIGSSAIGAGLGVVDDIGYADTVRRGYLLMTVTAASVKGEYVFVDTVKSRTYTASVGRTITVAASGGVTYG